MRSLLLALPLLALAPGCAEPCSSPALTVSWRFDLAGGATDADCQAAGVARVSLWLDGQPSGLGMSCAQGAATFGGLAAGSHVYTIQGLTDGGAVRYQEWGALPVDGCGETRVVLRPGAGTLQLAYATVSGSCSPAGDTPPPYEYLWYWVRDVDTGQYAAYVDGGHGPDTVPCQAAPGQSVIDIELPYGNYSLRGMQDVRYPLTTPYTVFQSCTPVDVTLHRPGTTTVDVLLDVPAGQCSL